MLLTSLNILLNVLRNDIQMYNEDYMTTAGNSKYVLSDEGDSLLFDICHILNCCSKFTI